MVNLRSLLVETGQVEANFIEKLSQLRKLLRGGTNGSNAVELITSRIKDGFLRRDSTHLRNLFEGFCENGVLMKDRLKECLDELRIPCGDVDKTLETIDCNNDGTLDWEEFNQYLSTPTPLQQWTRSLPVADVVADAISVEDVDNPMWEISKLSTDHIKSICEGLRYGMETLLTEEVAKLRESLSAIENKKNVATTATKFQVIKMSSGTADDYHNGLEGRVGAPHLKFMDAMEAEHTKKFGFNCEFETSNYRVCTCPKTEWQLLIRRKGLGEAEFATLLAGEFPKVELGRMGRRVPDVLKLLRSEASAAARLIEAEVIAIVLYTGPMFQLYNAVLRQFPADVFQQQRKGGNLFTTTIHVLVSAVQKLSRAIPLAEGTRLFRGLGGTLSLPEGFFRADHLGRRGYAEWGFMSTTSNREVALQYSGVKEGKPRAMVLAIRTGALDRGACLQEFSQYPGEKEYLWLPLSFIEPDGIQSLEVTEDGVVSVVPAKVMPNLQASTIEEAVARKKTMHVAAFRFVLDALPSELAEAAERAGGAERLALDKTAHGVDMKSLVERIVVDCKERLTEHERIAPERYIDEDEFRELTVDMLETSAMAHSKLRWWLEDRATYIASVLEESLRSAHRAYVSFLQRGMTDSAALATERCGASGRFLRAVRPWGAWADWRAKALALCCLRGLVRGRVDQMTLSGETPLLCAAADGTDVSALRLLLAAGAAVASGAVTPSASRFRRELPPLDLALLRAVRQYREDVVEALLESRASVNAQDSSEKSAVFLAASEGNDAVLRVLVKHGADIHKPRDSGWTPLHQAADKGHVAAVRVLLEAGAKINVHTTDDEYTPLRLAGSNGYEPVVRVLLDAKADVNAVDEQGCTALQRAARYGHVGVMRMLVEAGGDIHIKNGEGQTAVFMAADRGQGEALQLLVSLGADLAIRDKEDWTVLHQAAQGSNDGLIRMLVELGSQVDCRTSGQHTPLRLAASKGKEKVISALLELKADVNAVDDEGVTPLVKSAANGHEAAVRLLLEAKADSSILSKDGQSALMKAASQKEGKALKALLLGRVDPNLVDSEGWTALHFGGQSGSVEGLRALVEAQAVVDARTKGGHTPLRLASSKRGREEAVKTLLELKADVNAVDDEGVTPLMKAVGNNLEAAARLLLEAKADTSMLSKEGTAALHVVAVGGMSVKADLVRMLVEAGADVNQRDQDGCTALRLAAGKGVGKVAELLQAKADVDTPDKNGVTALAKAAEAGHKAVVKLLVEAKADLALAAKEHGTTAMHAAAARGRGEVLQLLVDAAADLNARDQAGATAVLLAAKGGHWVALKLLAQARADLSAADAETVETPLHLAARSKKEDVVRALLEAKADPDALNREGKTALDLAPDTPFTPFLRSATSKALCGDTQPAAASGEGEDKGENEEEEGDLCGELSKVGSVRSKPSPALPSRTQSFRPSAGGGDRTEEVLHAAT